MAKKTMLGGLGKKLAGTWKKHKEDDTTYGIINLPGGISSGIAQFSGYTFGKYKSGANKGVDFCRLAGTVRGNFPNAADMPTDGLQTGIMLPLGETKNAKGEVTDAEDNIARFMNELRKLGCDTSDTDIFDDNSLLELMEALKDAAPYFRFSTTTPDDKGRCFENWAGNKGLEDYEPEEDEEVEEDDTPEEEADEEVEEEESTEEEEGGEEDLEELAALADSEDEEAQEQLTAMAEAAGIDPNDYETWKDVVEALTSANGEEVEYEDAEEEEEQEEFEPSKEDVVMYKPPRAKKAVECVVTKVLKSKKIADLDDLENEGKNYKNVPWNKLEPVE